MNDEQKHMNNTMSALKQHSDFQTMNSVIERVFALLLECTKEKDEKEKDV